MLEMILEIGCKLGWITANNPSPAQTIKLGWTISKPYRTTKQPKQISCRLEANKVELY